MRTLGFLLSILLSLASLPGQTLEKGDIDGALFTIAKPAEWTGKLVLLAHGYRPEDAALSADLDTKDAFVAPLLKKGWMVAITSYRRNGWIVDDALDDLNALQEHIASQHGEIRRCLVSGSSMGGLIAVLIGEGALDGVDGVVAIGAYLGDGQTDAFHPKLTWDPKMPILFLTNQSELEHPRAYRERANHDFTALWEIKRNGHCNTSAAERFQAIQAVNAWIDGQPPEKDRDGTLEPPVRASTAQPVKGGLEGTIRKSSPSWGNLGTDFVAADLTTLHLARGDSLMVEAGDRSIAARLVGDRSEVAEGECAVYLSPNGWVEIEIQGGHAARKVGVAVKDRVRLIHQPTPATPEP
ncbi:dienelactone hydrolase [Haloferula luteola]|uniref:Dienelactone hydrolase n=1 Tax=Haloferula luteola TaxID=595692 RepID=A0A840VH48_9BACT|nr:SAM hydroxide adenosyltransferase [Haloferula luteola]MBB5353149.1 dienelactone hydrolase [Haloferula luteola]